MKRRLNSMMLVAVMFSLTACTRVGAPLVPAPPSEVVAGTFGGVLSVEGTGMEGLLVLTVVDGRYQAVFDSESFGFEASGEGRFRGAHLELVLAYEMDCRGELRMRGIFLADKGQWDGELVASDCTGDAAGEFHFQRRAR